jgi:hypothetical protein
MKEYDRVRRIVERKLGKKYTTLEEKEARKAEILKANFK